jgi:thiol peroxidase
MAEVTFKGNPLHTNGELPQIGSKAPNFVLTGPDLADRSLTDFEGRKKILNIVPSLDTKVCAISTRRFNGEAKLRDDLQVVVISADLPFAQHRFCEAENCDAIATLSMMRDKRFAESYGVLLTDGPLAGLCARAVLVLDENDTVIHAQLVPEIAEEPDYKAALDALG